MRRLDIEFKDNEPTSARMDWLPMTTFTTTKVVELLKEGIDEVRIIIVASHIDRSYRLTPPTPGES
jgi:hypothetical protein